MLLRLFLIATLATHFLPTVSHAAEPLKPAPVDYTTFEGKKVELFAWRGKHMAFLTKREDLDTKLMAELCTTFDKIYVFYHESTGRLPAKMKELDGLLSVAEVDQTCGAACGYLGATGIELTPGVFVQLYSGFETGGTIDQAPPYEFGRNFWFYSPQLAYKQPVSDRSVVTGYAVFMRMVALDAAKAKLGPFRDKSGPEFRKIMESLVDLYEADKSQTWENTLKVDAAPKNPLGLNGTDLFASFCLRLARDHGGAEFVKRLWHAAGKRPAAATTEDALDNFVIAASIAARKDLGAQFSDTWRWPVSPAAREAAAKAASPEDEKK
jgi:serralysin